MKHESTTSHLKLKDRKLSGQQLVKVVQSDRKLNSGLARLWHPYFWTRMGFCLSTILPGITESIERRNQEKTASYSEEKSAVPPK